MSQAENVISQEKNGSGGLFAKMGLMPGFTASIFLSALLLFSVQPMFAKMTLPLLGGVPNVWNTAMVFFQATLLAGYVYAHFLSKYTSLKVQIGVHTSVLIVGMLFLPLAVANGWTPPAEGAPAFWLMALYAVSIGVPFFALSATAPLLQRWFSYTDHKNAQDPYFLYAASNLGSLLSLLAFPVLIEPMLGVSSQAQVWTLGYYALAVAIISSGFLAILNHIKVDGSEKQDVLSDNNSVETATTVTWRKRAIWIALAFVPSSLMLGVTTHFSVNVATAPFVWVAPLAIYLLTFVFVFAQKPVISEDLIARMLPIAVVMGAILGIVETHSFFVLLGSHLFIFFVITMRFHGRLAAMRPSVSKLTEFYICMSVGGVLGGMFNALIAPIIFGRVYEYMLIMAISGLAAAGSWPNAKSVWRDVLFALGIFVFVTLYIFVMRTFAQEIGIIVNLGLSAAYVVIYAQNKKPVRFVAGLLAMQLLLTMVAPRFYADGENREIFNERSFFGVTRVAEIVTEEGDVIHEFIHGNTIHNQQFVDPAKSKVMISYFSKEGPWGRIMDVTRTDKARPLNVSVIGLGAGALACYAEPGDSWRFYEIDPAIVRMAKDPALFTYLSECTPDAPVVIGDARLQIQHEPSGQLDLLLVDAFSSDAIPAHLVTREAMTLYRSKMKEDGIMFFHTSNRYADVSSVVVNLARDAGLTALEMSFNPEEDTPYFEYIAPAMGVAVGPKEVMDRAFAGKDEWVAIDPHPAVGVWTDDYSHIVGALIAKKDAKKRDATAADAKAAAEDGAGQSD